MEYYQQTKLTEDNRNVNWHAIATFSAIWSVIIGVLISLIITAFFLYQHLTLRLARDWRFSGKVDLFIYLFFFIFFSASTFICGIREYIRYKHLKSAIITTAFTFCLGGGLVLTISFILFTLMDNFFGQNYPMKTD